MKNKFIYLSLIAVLFLLGFGCGRTDFNEPVAIIDGKYVITVEEFLYRYERAQANLSPEETPEIYEYDEARETLDRIITGRLLEIEAEERGYDDEYLKKTVSDFGSNLLADKLREDIKGEIKINESQALDFYNSMGEQRYVQVIFSTDARAIESAFEEIEAGVSFVEAAAVYNEDPKLRSSGGEIENAILYDGSLFARQVFTIRDTGDVTDVIYSEDDSGYLIIRLVSKELNENSMLPEYTQIKEGIRTELTEILTDKKLNKLLDKRSAAASVEYDDEVYGAVFDLRQKELRKRYLREGHIVCTANDEPVYFDEWFEGVGLQTGMSDAALDDFKRERAGAYKDMMDGRLNVFIRSALARAEAKKRGLDTTESYFHEVSNFRSGLLIERLNGEYFGRVLPLPSVEERLAYFEANRREFIIREKMSGFYFATTNKNILGEVYNRVISGEDIVRIASEIARPGETLESGYPLEAGFFDIYKDPSVDDSRNVPQSMMKMPLKGLVYNYNAGQISPLISLGNDIYLFFVNFKYTPYTEAGINVPGVMSEINNRLYSEASTGPMAESKYKLWFDKLRKEHKIEINEGGLENAFEEINRNRRLN